MVDMVHQLQDRICEAVEAVDGTTYREDEWVRPEGGGGRSRVFSGGEVFELSLIHI